jgi:ATP-binding cassette subfamily F protein uup
MPAPILSYEGLGLIQGEGWLFQNLDLYIGERDRLALIGRNGAGKTTLLKCLAGLIDPDKGKRTIVPGTHVVLLEQDPQMEGFETLRDWVAHGVAAPEQHEAAAIADQLGIDLSRPTATASGGGRRSPEHSRKIPTSCCWTNRPTISILARSSGWRTGSSASAAHSSRSATTAPS